VNPQFAATLTSLKRTSPFVQLGERREKLASFNHESITQATEKKGEGSPVSPRRIGGKEYKGEKRA